MTVLWDLVDVPVQAAVASLWEGALLAAMVWLALRTVPKTSAATRYAVWCVALAAVAILPFVTAWPSAVPAAVSAVAGAVPAKPAWSPFEIPVSWAAGLFLAWTIVALLGTLRLALSYLALRGLRRASKPAPEMAGEALRLAMELSGMRRPVSLRISAAVRVPMTAGLFRPLIVLPESLAGSLTPPELQKILLHELAHIGRRDAWTNLAQRFAQAALFFNPAVHFIARQLELEREVACDDRVVALTGEARPYAACLAKLVELRAFHSSPQAALGAVTRLREITRRVELLVRRTRNASPRFSPAAAGAASAALALSAALFAHVPPVIAVAGPAAVPGPAPAARVPVAPAAALVKPGMAAPAVRPVSRTVVRRRVPATRIASAKRAKPHEESGIFLQPVSIYMDVKLDNSSGLVLVQQWQGTMIERRLSAGGNWILILIQAPPQAELNHT